MVAVTLAASYLPITSQQSDRAAVSDSDRKDIKYAELARSYIFMLLAFHTLGPSGNKAIDCVSGLGHCTTAVTGDPREGSHLFQLISVAIQRFNSVCFRSYLCHPARH